MRRALVLLAGLRAPTLAPLVRSAAVPGGVALTHHVPAAAVSLASVRATGPLRAGHVLAVGVAVLEALVALHGAGLAHGGVDGDSVLVAPDGSVVLASTGAAWRVAPRQPDGPAAAEDVAAVGELLRDLLGPGSAPAPLVVAVVRAVDPDLALRPDAAALLEALRRCGRPDTLLDALWTPRRDPRVVERASASTDPPPVSQTGPSLSGPSLSGPSLTAPARPGALRPPSTRARRSRPGTAWGRAGLGRAWTQGRLVAVVLLAGLAVAAATVVGGRSSVPVDPPTAAAAGRQPAAVPSSTAAGQLIAGLPAVAPEAPESPRRPSRPSQPRRPGRPSRLRARRRPTSTGVLCWGRPTGAGPRRWPPAPRRGCVRGSPGRRTPPTWPWRAPSHRRERAWREVASCSTRSLRSASARRPRCSGSATGVPPTGCSSRGRGIRCPHARPARGP